MEINEVIGLMSVLIPGCGLFAVWHQLRQARRATQAGIILSFYQRFSELEDAFPEYADRSQWHILLNEDDDLPADAKVFFRKYFYLCSEEYQLNSMTRIPRRVWAAWEKEMRYNFSYAVCKRAWADLRHKFDYQPRFMNFVDERMK